jgi:hypothetical protein
MTLFWLMCLALVCGGVAASFWSRQAGSWFRVTRVRVRIKPARPVCRDRRTAPRAGSAGETPLPLMSLATRAHPRSDIPRGSPPTS